MDVTMLLCDAAEAVNGKLYVIGGGWSQAKAVPGQPLSMALAILIHVPWDRANDAMPMMLELTSDGVPVDLGKGPVRADGTIEVGRPVGLTKGASLDVTLAPRFTLSLQPGEYAWNLWLDGEPVQSIPFWVRASKN